MVMKLNEHKRHKAGQMPGELPIQTKAKLLEKENSPHSKAYRKHIKQRCKKRQRMRDKQKEQEI
jgi:hypothetical protein